MPKVSEAHVEARRQQIVDAAFLCFARKGFHPTTMQEICAEAGLSPGAIYTYFDSKESIILEACNASQQATDEELLAKALEQDDMRAVLHGLAQAFLIRLDGPEAEVLNKAVLQLWAETAVNEEVRASYEERYQAMRAALLKLVNEGQRRGDFNRALDSDAIVSAMFALHDGFRLQKANHPEMDTEAYMEAAEAMTTGRFWTRDR